MSLFSKFKKDYLNYLLSIIIPAIISGTSIPLFKQLLGSEGYGRFALWFNAVMIFTAVMTGWIAQSIIRFYPSSNDKNDFVKKSRLLLKRIIFIVIIPVSIIVWIISNDYLLVILFILALLSVSFQLITVPVIQSSFLSKKIIFSEMIRIMVYAGCGILLLLVSNIFYLYILLSAVILGYTTSFLYLFISSRKKLQDHDEIPIINNTSELISKFYNYGIPLSFWFVLSYLMTYVDKLFALYNSGGLYQGNYQALFDFIYKSLGLVIAPAITALFPLITTAYELGGRKEIRVFLKKILYYEVLFFVVISIGYWLFGASLLFYILKIPDTLSFKWIGFIIICSSFLWQFSIIIQKKFELRLKTSSVLFMVAMAFMVQIIFYFLNWHSPNEFIAPLGFLISTFVYFMLILLTGTKKQQVF